MSPHTHFSYVIKVYSLLYGEGNAAFEENVPISKESIVLAARAAMVIGGDFSAWSGTTHLDVFPAENDWGAYVFDSSGSIHRKRNRKWIVRKELPKVVDFFLAHLEKKDGVIKRCRENGVDSPPLDLVNEVVLQARPKHIVVVKWEEQKIGVAYAEYARNGHDDALYRIWRATKGISFPKWLMAAPYTLPLKLMEHIGETPNFSGAYKYDQFVYWKPLFGFNTEYRRA